MGGRHQAALLDRIVEECESRRRTGCPARLKPHLLQDARHTVSDLRGRCQREIDDAERDAKAA